MTEWHTLDVYSYAPKEMGGFPQADLLFLFYVHETDFT